jgi:hypothetical protein
MYKSLKDAVCSVMEVPSNRYGFISYRIILHWPEIVGQGLARLSYPLQVLFDPGKAVDGTLIIGIANPGFALELHSASSLILSKLAVYFGYKAVSNIKIKIAKQSVFAVKEPVAQPQIKYRNKTQLISAAEDEELSLLLSELAARDSDLAEVLRGLKDTVFSRE